MMVCLINYIDVRCSKWHNFIIGISDELVTNLESLEKHLPNLLTQILQIYSLSPPTGDKERLFESVCHTPLQKPNFSHCRGARLDCVAATQMSPNVTFLNIFLSHVGRAVN